MSRLHHRNEGKKTFIHATQRATFHPSVLLSLSLSVCMWTAVSRYFLYLHKCTHAICSYTLICRSLITICTAQHSKHTYKWMEKVTSVSCKIKFKYMHTHDFWRTNQHCALGVVATSKAVERWKFIAVFNLCAALEEISRACSSQQQKKSQYVLKLFKQQQIYFTFATFAFNFFYRV